MSSSSPCLRAAEEALSQAGTGTDDQVRYLFARAFVLASVRIALRTEQVCMINTCSRSLRTVVDVPSDDVDEDVTSTLLTCDDTLRSGTSPPECVRFAIDVLVLLARRWKKACLDLADGDWHDVHVREMKPDETCDVLACIGNPKHRLRVGTCMLRHVEEETSACRIRDDLEGVLTDNPYTYKQWWQNDSSKETVYTHLSSLVPEHRLWAVNVLATLCTWVPNPKYKKEDDHLSDVPPHAWKSAFHTVDVLSHNEDAEEERGRPPSSGSRREATRLLWCFSHNQFALKFLCNHPRFDSVMDNVHVCSMSACSIVHVLDFRPSMCGREFVFRYMHRSRDEDPSNVETILTRVVHACEACGTTHPHAKQTCVWRLCLDVGKTLEVVQGEEDEDNFVSVANRTHGLIKGCLGETRLFHVLLSLYSTERNDVPARVWQKTEVASFVRRVALEEPTIGTCLTSAMNSYCSGLANTFLNGADKDSIQDRLSEARVVDETWPWMEVLLCPIRLEPFRYPVFMNDGHTYELSAAWEWERNRILTGNDKVPSPLRGEDWLQPSLVAPKNDVVVALLDRVVSEEGSAFPRSKPQTPTTSGPARIPSSLASSSSNTSLPLVRRRRRYVASGMRWRSGRTESSASDVARV